MAWWNPLSWSAGAQQAAGEVASAKIAANAQNKANETNIMLAREAREFNSAEALKQREFEQGLSNTAHQREIQDLQKAGLNPALSMGGSGASTPSGASASGSAATVQPATMAPAFKRIISAAMEIKNQQKDLETKDATVKMNNAVAKLKDAETEVATATARSAKARADYDEKFYQNEKNYIKIDKGVKYVKDGASVIGNVVGGAFIGKGLGKAAEIITTSARKGKMKNHTLDLNRSEVPKGRIKTTFKKPGTIEDPYNLENGKLD